MKSLMPAGVLMNPDNLDVVLLKNWRPLSTARAAE
jgi:hypothetical protein